MLGSEASDTVEGLGPDLGLLPASACFARISQEIQSREGKIHRLRGSQPTRLTVQDDVVHGEGMSNTVGEDEITPKLAPLTVRVAPPNEGKFGADA